MPRPSRCISARSRFANVQLGPNHPDVAGSLNNLALLQLGSRNYPAAETYFQRALEILERTFGSDHAQVALALNNLAKVDEEQGKSVDAERGYVKALSILEAARGKDHPLVDNTVMNLATLHHRLNQPIEARPYFERGVRSLTRRLEQEFSYMTEKERLEFIETVRGVFPHYFSFCFSFREKYPALAGQMYDAVLYQKGMVAAGVAATRSKIAASGDAEASALFSALTEKKRQLFRLISSPSDDRATWREQLSRVEREAGDLERDLTKRSTAFAETRPVKATWQDVARRLKRGEAAVEFVKFPFYDGRQSFGVWHYVALILTADAASGPTLVPLGEASVLECGPLNEYSVRIAPFRRQGKPCLPADGKSALALTPTFYEAFWKPLEPALAAASRVYVSLDGILNQISLSVVADDKGRMLLDRYDLRFVLSTRDLLRDPTVNAAKSAVLIGNPLFTIDESLQVASARPYQILRGVGVAASTNTFARSDTALRGPPLDQLPGTKQELEWVARALRAQSWTVSAHEGKDAVVEAMKAVSGPRLLHVATHGEFASDRTETRRTFSSSGGGSPGPPSIMNDPMLRSGLFFTGANRYRAGLPPADGADDGVLTAYEASQLNLNGTELVVLSACKTGLGQSRHGEGVFGLRRAFQVAGAQAVMMSMWSVPDSETQELMTLFYQKWLAGADKHAALHDAQREMHKKTGDPSTWGAFVLVGR